MIKTFDFRKLIPCILFPLTVGIIGAFFSKDSSVIYPPLNKPPFAPPGWLFPIAWSIIYILIGVSHYLILVKNPKIQSEINRVYILSLALNLLWPLFFFVLNWFAFAAFEIVLLLISVIWLFILYRRVYRLAAYLNIPYILWLLFALYLNIGVAVLN